jgi:hypothetical protein
VRKYNFNHELTSSSFQSASNDDDDIVENSDGKGGKQSEKETLFAKDTAAKKGISRDRATSGLSPANSEDNVVAPPIDPRGNNNDEKKNVKQTSRSKKKSSLLPRALMNENGKNSDGGNARMVAKPNRKQNPNSQGRKSEAKDSFSSLLPPPVWEKGKSAKYEDDSLAYGLSSWEDFLGSGKRPIKAGTTEMPPKAPTIPNLRNQQGENGDLSSNDPFPPTTSIFTQSEPLPSITDLFPPDFPSTLNSRNTTTSQPPDSSRVNRKWSAASPTLDGVLPVSDLFYRSAQSMDDDDDFSEGDDEELPFSAEQSDQLSSDHNKIKIRRNQAEPSKGTTSSNPPFRMSKRKGKASSQSRKMVRRGMEMLVGGIPINADPPQRYLDLSFRHEESDKWHEAISINSKDFGPMHHASSVGLLSRIEQGLFCEHFVHNAIKWDVCPKYLKDIAHSYESFGSQAEDELEKEENQIIPDDLSPRLGGRAPEHPPMTTVSLSSESSKTDSSGRGFGNNRNIKTKGSSKKGRTGKGDPRIHLGGELVFSVGISREDLEFGGTTGKESILERVLTKGITIATESAGFDVHFTKLLLTDMDDGSTLIAGVFVLEPQEKMSFSDLERKALRINSSLAQAMDDGAMQLAMAAAAKEESGWPKAIRDRVVEEFLFEDDDIDDPFEDEDKRLQIENKVTEMNENEAANLDDDMYDDTVNSLKKLQVQEPGEYDGPFGMPGSSEYHHDDLFLGGGNDGVFWDYSESNIQNSPYRGELGPRLLEAVVEMQKEQSPRVIAIGDVHGCIDELQDLLRQCDYSPGDLVVFLGDLVSKGPDSISVVQMAREIGAIGVRGNHDFEVIRWHQAIKSGVDPPVVASEHFHIASCLSKGDMKWLYSLPWYISSKELGALFVHAGFVSGIRLAKQNPRLMMNMRSILPDGTVTSKFFNNWPWARLWDGPQTVLFGHDADRGLQQYEHAVGLDTGCVYGGRLTACILPEKRLVSVSARREYFKYRRKHYD